MTSPDLRPPSPERSAALTSVIRSEIQASPSARITFRRFMQLALYHTELGYYRSPAERPTRRGDFLTAPETHPMFGWTLSRWLEARWIEFDRPEPFHLIEYGAGSGTLALTLIEGLRRRPAVGASAGRGLLDALRYRPLETNPHRLDDLTERFETAGLARLLDLPAPASSAGGTDGIGVAPVAGALIANEFLDALPVHRVVSRAGVLGEVYVGWRDGTSGFVELVGEPSTPELAARLAGERIELADGQVAEICLEIDSWLGEVACRLAPGRAAGLILDYGYEAAELYGPRHLAGTLLGYRGHRVVDRPLADPGDVDLTAHVDFTAVRAAAERHGFRSGTLRSQAEFLLGAGLESEWQAIRASALTAADYTTARAAILRLLDPRHLGGFRVLELVRA